MFLRERSIWRRPSPVSPPTLRTPPKHFGEESSCCPSHVLQKPAIFWPFPSQSSCWPQRNRPRPSLARLRLASRHGIAALLAGQPSLSRSLAAALRPAVWGRAAASSASREGLSAAASAVLSRRKSSSSTWVASFLTAADSLACLLLRLHRC